MLDNPGSISIKANTLAGVRLFQALSKDDRALIARHCHGRTFPSHHQILTQNSHSRDVYFIISGEVRVTYFSSSGKEISFRDQYAGEMFGELAAIDGLARSADIRALTDTTLAIMKPDDFRNLLAENPALAFEVMQHLTNLVRLLSERIVEFSALAVKTRIQAEVLRLSRKAGIIDSKIIIKPKPTHIDLARRVSTHREAVTRELIELENKKIIERHRDHWVILDIEGLQNLLSASAVKS